MIGHIVGSYDLDVVLAAGDFDCNHDLYRVALVLVALGALTKSAQFPFHFWLPHAMAAPTPVSSYLHSATMVKAGVFLLVRMWPALAGTPEWTWIVGGAGVYLMVIGAFIAIFQHDLKGLLAYSTISHLGLITVLIGIGTPMAIVAAIFHILNHAVFKASLFMTAGIIDHETGTRDLRLLRGLRHSLPITATLAIVASAAMAEVPLLNGFLSKEMFFAETIHVGGDSNWWMSVAAVAMGMFSVAYSLRFISVFLWQTSPGFAACPPRTAALDALSGGVAGPGLPGGRHCSRVEYRTAIAPGGHRCPWGGNPHPDLAVWHGVNLPLLMSVCALGGGVLLYLVLRRHFHLQQREHVPLIHRLNGAQVYETMMLQITRGAEWLLRHVGTQRLQPQLMLMMLKLAAHPAADGRPRRCGP